MPIMPPRPYIERGHDGEDDYDYYELEKKLGNG